MQNALILTITGLLIVGALPFLVSLIATARRQRRQIKALKQQNDFFDRLGRALEVIDFIDRENHAGTLTMQQRQEAARKLDQIWGKDRSNIDDTTKNLLWPSN